MTALPNTDRVYTRSELANATGRVTFGRKGDYAYVRLVLRGGLGERAWRMTSPCCGAVTVLPHSVLDQVATGRWQHAHIQCGKPWALTPGPPRNGCYATYELTPGETLDGDEAPAVRLSWTGY